jgi:hypothetical protein
MSVRKGSKWRSRAFKTIWMCQMGKCEHCGLAESFIYRRAGVSGSFLRGDLHQIVWRSSNLELDHIIPLHRGGSNDYENLQLLCRDCHKEKTAAEHPRRRQEELA